MFSKKTIVVAVAIALVVLNGVVFSFNYIRKSSFQTAAVQTVLFFIGPLQESVTRTVRFAEDIWIHYFFLVSTARENENLRRKLALVEQQINSCHEISLANARLKQLLNFKSSTDCDMVAAEVVAMDPSPWYRTVIINKGVIDGVEKGFPVVVPEGIVGKVIGVSGNYAKVQLIIDRNSATDAMDQRTRARGILDGLSSQECSFEYALRKLDISVGDVVITSGFDGIFPKGLPIGRISKVIRRNSGIFQEIKVTPYVDFDKLEEVLVILNPPEIENTGE